MTALSIQEPWISMIVRGEKTIETRTRRTSYRGPLLLCSSKTVDQTNLRPGDPIGPQGYAVGVADLVDCHPMRPDDMVPACCSYHMDRFSWILANVRPLKTPFPVRGQRGLFKVEVPEELLP